MENSLTPTARYNDIVVQRADNEILIYDLVTNRASCLNETAAFVWEHCNGLNDIPEIARALALKFDNDVSSDLVWLAINELSRNKLLQENFSAKKAFDGMSRRNMIKKVGLGAFIALPIVASLVAPHAVHANSACITGGTCTCNTTMGTANSEPCSTAITGVACIDPNCQCIRTNQGNAAGTCGP